jgi:hypothetical protein
MDRLKRLQHHEYIEMCVLYHDVEHVWQIWSQLDRERTASPLPAFPPWRCEAAAAGLDAVARRQLLPCYVKRVGRNSTHGSSRLLGSC